MAQDYDKRINDEYELILGTLPHHTELREIVADQIVTYVEGSTGKVSILEFGSGRGETLVVLLSRLKSLKLLEKVAITSIDYDEAVLTEQENLIRSFGFDADITFLSTDILGYLLSAKPSSLNICTSSWTLHNFSRNERELLLSSIHKILKPDGFFIAMDKYVPNDKDEEEKLFVEQMEQFANLSLKHENLVALLEHEKKDRTPDYIMRAGESIEVLRKLEFSDSYFIKHIRRDAVLIARK